MYTATLIGDTKNIDLRRRMVNVEFTDGKTTFAKEFQFRIDETVENMKRTVKQYLDELNFIPPTLNANIADYVEPTPDAPVVDTARQTWNEDREKLRVVMELVRDGVFTGDEAQITTLQTKVKKGFKPEYLS